MTGDKAESRSTRILLASVALITLLHCALWFAHYNQTALGESPALDNRQNLELAQAIEEGSLAAEPFHRAPLYPFILSLFLSLGLPFELLPLAARWLNGLALAVAASSTAYMALRFWGKPACGWLAGMLIALNPVLVYFAGDAFDMVLATTCFSLVLPCLHRWLVTPTPRTALLIGILLALGAGLRSHILPLALIWPVAAFLFGKGKRISNLTFSVIPIVLSFFLLGIANLNVSGEFRVMPWQGAYNFWAGNRPDADGRIFAQQIRVKFGEGYDNPAKLESITLYERETGESPPHSVGAMNTYWKGKTLQHIADHPMQWLGLMSRKAYYFLNSYEQYDNKTYSFHRDRHKLLKLNPLHWGLLLTLTVCGALIALADRRRRPFAIACILCFGAYAAGTILFYTSNRFRLPMLPMLAYLSAGALFAPAYWEKASKHLKYLFVTCLVLTLGITYSSFFNANKKNTWEEDFALLANASLRTGRDLGAAINAREALAMNPNRSDMHAVLAQVEFNNWALAEDPLELTAEKAESLLSMTRSGSRLEEDLIALIGVYQWKIGRRDEALATWESVHESDALARLCLFWTGHERAPNETELRQYSGHPSQLLLQEASRLSPDQKTNGLIPGFMDQLLSPVEGSPPEENSTSELQLIDGLHESANGQ